ncbi:hypothetical protein Hamer_G003908, partial [Homarus americanus]
MIGGPQIATLVKEFEESSHVNAKEQLQHHEQVPSFQSKFRAHVQSMVDTITDLGNPFSDESKEPVSLGSNIVAGVSVVKTVGAVKETGLLQYQTFVKERLIDHSKSTNEPLPQKKFTLLKDRPKQAVHSKNQALFLMVADYEQALSLICCSALKNSEASTGEPDDSAVVIDSAAVQMLKPCRDNEDLQRRRGTGTRRRVMPSSPLPRNCPEFLRVDENKTELFHLSQHIIQLNRDGKVIIVIAGQDVLCVRDYVDLSQLAPCSHEEADSRSLWRNLDNFWVRQYLQISASSPICICHGTIKSKGTAYVPCH